MFFTMPGLTHRSFLGLTANECERRFRMVVIGPRGRRLRAAPTSKRRGWQMLRKGIFPFNYSSIDTICGLGYLYGQYQQLRPMRLHDIFLASPVLAHSSVDRFGDHSETSAMSQPMWSRK
jgi:hypothetical protein